MKPILKVQNLSKDFIKSLDLVAKGLNRIGQNYKEEVVHAVDDVNFSIFKGEIVGVVGESGCGKSTLGRMVAGILRPSTGSVEFDSSQANNEEIPSALRTQMIFQDPMESLNARHTVGEILEEPFLIHGIGNAQTRRQSVSKLLDTVGLPGRSASRYPFEFSGGQRQRIGIARAIALKPELIICDEPVSALDVSIQSQILNLLMELQKEFNLAYLFIAHDLAVVKHISDRVAIMYLGKIVEQASSNEIYHRPFHPYTQSLISAIPIPDPHHSATRILLKGDVPSPISPPPGCAFHTRCPKASESCQRDVPILKTVAPEHIAACHFAEAP